MTNLLRSSLIAAAALGAAITGYASPASFDFKDPKGVNNVHFKLDAPLESISGTATGISGQISFDPEKPAETKGRIVLDAASLTVGNPVMTEHLRGESWLDVKKHQTITFEAEKLANVKTQGNKTTADVAGTLTVKGISKKVTIPVTFTYLADKLGARIGKPEIKGDLLVLRGNFTINRNDFDIQAGQATDKVAETIDISLSIAGATLKK